MPHEVAYTFGLSEWEIFWPLVAGATLILAPPGWDLVAGEDSVKTVIYVLDGSTGCLAGGEKDADYLLRRACNAFVPPEPKEAWCSYAAVNLR